ncbi:MAG: hypothetical protein ACI82O_003621, partial [Patiriisocius sp.]
WKVEARCRSELPELSQTDSHAVACFFPLNKTSAES